MLEKGNNPADFVLRSPCAIFGLRAEDRLRLGIKNKGACFVLRSPCAIFVTDIS